MSQQSAAKAQRDDRKSTAVRLAAEGKSRDEIASALGVARRTVFQLLADVREETGELVETCASAEQREAHALRVLGLSSSEIAARLGISKQAAAQRLSGYDKFRRLAGASQFQAIRSRIIDVTELLLERYLPLASDGDVAAAGVVDKALARQQALLPSKTELSGPNGGPLQAQAVAPVVDLSRLTDEQLAQLQQVMAVAAVAPAAVGALPAPGGDSDSDSDGEA